MPDAETKNDAQRTRMEAAPEKNDHSQFGAFGILGKPTVQPAGTMPMGDAERELRRKCMTLDTARQLLRGDNPHHDTSIDKPTRADRELVDVEARLDWTHAATMVREAFLSGKIKEQSDDAEFQREYLGNPTLPADDASDGVAHAPNDAAEKRRRQRMSIERAREILGRDDPTTEAPSVNDVDSDVMARQDWFFAQWLVGSTVEGKVWPDDDRQRLAEHRMGVRSRFTVEEAREITAGPDPHDDKSMDQPTEWGYELTERCHDWIRATNIVADDAAGVELAPTIEPAPKPKRARHVGTWMIEKREGEDNPDGSGWGFWQLCSTVTASPPVTSLDTAERWIKKHGEVGSQYRVIVEKGVYTPTMKRTDTVRLF